MPVGELADEYFARNIPGRWKHPNIVRARIEKDIKPNMGSMRVDDVKPSHEDAMLQTIVKRGAPTIAKDVLRWTRRIVDYAVKRHMVRYSPAAAFNVADAGGKPGRAWRGPAHCRAVPESQDQGRRGHLQPPRLLRGTQGSAGAVGGPADTSGAGCKQSGSDQGTRMNFPFADQLRIGHKCPKLSA